MVLIVLLYSNGNNMKNYKSTQVQFSRLTFELPEKYECNSVGFGMTYAKN